MTLRILVSRPQPGAGRTSKRLAAEGFHPLVEPMLTVATVDVELPRFRPGQAIALTSPNGALRVAQMTEDRDVEVYCIGSATRDEAISVGFKNTHSAEGDSHDLVAYIARNRKPSDGPVLHVANRDAGDRLAGRLRSEGFDAEALHVYRTLAVTKRGPVLSAMLAGTTRVDAMLVHSPKSARTLAALLAPGAPVDAAIIAISNAAADPLRAASKTPPLVAEAPTDQAIMDALKQWAQTA